MCKNTIQKFWRCFLPLSAVFLLWSCSNGRAEVEVYDSIFSQYHENGQIAEGIDSLLSRSDREQSRYGHALGYLDRSLLNVRKGNMTAAVHDMELAQSAIDVSDPLFLQGYSDYVRANILHSNADMAKAVEYYHHAAETFEQLRDTDYLFKCYTGMASACQSLNSDDEKADFYRQKAAELASPKVHDRLVIDSIYTILRQDRPREALSRWKRLRQEWYSEGKKGDMVHYYEQGCLIYHALGKNDTALMYLNLQDSLLQLHGSRDSRSYVLINRSSLYMEQGRYGEALTLYRQLAGRDTCIDGYNQQRLDGIRGIIEAHAAMGHADSALHYLDQFMSLNRQMIASIHLNDANVQQLEENYQSRLEQMEQKGLRRSRTLMLVLALLLMTGMALLALLRYRRLLAQTRQLQLENAERQLAQSQMQHAETQEQMQTYADQMRRIANAVPKNVRVQMMSNIEQLQLQQDKAAWQHFEEGFDLEHPGLRNRLLNHSPKMNTTEVRICMLLLTGQSTREMADTLHLSPESIKSARKVIRKKLNIDDPKMPLTDILEHF